MGGYFVARHLATREDVVVVHLVFQPGEEGLCHGIVPAHSGGSHRLDEPMVLAVVPELFGSHLGAMISVDDRPRRHRVLDARHL